MNDIIPLTYNTIPRILCATDLSILKRMVGASVAHQVLRSIDCDVLIAPTSAVRSSRDGHPGMALPDAAAAQRPAYW